MANARKADRKERIARLLDEAAKDNGEASVIAAMNELGAGVPEGLMPAVRALAAKPELVYALGDMAVQAEASWTQTISKNPLVREATRKRIEKMQKDLCGDSSSPLERMLVHRIAICWLHLNYVETLFAQRSMDSLSWVAISSYQNWLDRAHRRYLSAIKALAVVRKLSVPAIQVNIGEKQVNVLTKEQDGS